MDDLELTTILRDISEAHVHEWCDECITYGDACYVCQETAEWLFS